MPVAWNGFEITKLGHASVRIATPDGKILYIDPWSEVIEGSPHDADIVLISHDDFDHFDPDGIAAVSTEETSVAVYEKVDSTPLPHQTASLSATGTREIGGISIESVPAYNNPEGPHVDENGEPFHAENDGIGMLLKFAEVTIYYPSDTDFLAEHQIIDADVFLPPIGGHYTMNASEAAEFARSVKPELVIPVHYNTFEAIETDPEQFQREVERNGIRVVLD